LLFMRQALHFSFQLLPLRVGNHERCAGQLQTSEMGWQHLHLMSHDAVVKHPSPN
jgi:hypothetical protein